MARRRLTTPRGLPDDWQTVTIITISIIRSAGRRLQPAGAARQNGRTLTAAT